MANLLTEHVRFKEIVLSNLVQKEFLILAAIMTAAAIARFWSIGNFGLGGDESVYTGQALILSGHEELQRFFLLVSRGSSNFLVHQDFTSFYLLYCWIL